MESSFWTALSASTLAAAVTSIGIFTIRRFSQWGRSKTPYFRCFAAGVLLSASFLHIVPTAITLSPDAPVYLLVGFFGLHVFNRFLTGVVCEKDPEKADYSIGIVPMVGIGLHSLVDGVIYSITFTVSVFTGVLATAGMILHEFPEGIITYVLLVRGGLSERKSLLLALVAAGATTPLGMLISFPVISRIDQQTLGALLAMSAGARS